MIQPRCLLAFSLLCLSPMARSGDIVPKDGRFDFNFCMVADIVHLPLTDKTGIGHFTMSAAIHSNLPNGPFDRQSSTCAGTYSSTERRYIESGFCLNSDPDGDKWILKWTANPDGDVLTGTWTAAGGTGKYERLTASGSYKPVALIPPGPTGRIARCNNNTGTYALR